MAKKKLYYFRNNKAHAVAVATSDLFTKMLLENGFCECSNEEYFESRWLTWNDSTSLDIEGKTKGKSNGRKQ